MEMPNRRGDDAYGEKTPVAQPLLPKETRRPLPTAPLVEDEGWQGQEETLRLPTGLVVGVPAVVGGRYAYVGVPVDHPDDGIPPPPDARIGELGLSRGVGDDVAGANRAAKIRARRDAEDIRFTNAQARARVEEERRALEIGRLNAKIRDSEGLDMRPHPGNRFKPKSEYGSAGLRGEKASSFGGARGGARGSSMDNQEEEGAGKDTGEERAYSMGGYQVAEYKPSEYTVSQYKSVYDAPDASK